MKVATSYTVSKLLYASGASENTFRTQLELFSSATASLFPVWLTVTCVLALCKPVLFLWFRKEMVTGGLAITMISMGTTLTVDDFVGIMKMPGLVILGASLQYTIMPLLGFLVSRAAGLPEALAVGVCLVASCPGGVASNVVTYLAKADVPLSVLMTTASTMLCVVMTPFLVKLLVGSIVPVAAGELITSTLQVVLLPVAIGAFLNQSFPRQMKSVSPFAPLLAVAMTVLICGSIVAANAAAIQEASGRLVAAVAVLHGGGFLLGYLAARLVGVGPRQSRTISIEVGMQNSTLGAVLAAMHFADPHVAVPCAISACTHSLMGSAAAALFRRQDAQSSTAPSRDLPAKPQSDPWLT